MKKALSMIMALALVFGLVLIAAPAAEAAACDHTDHTGWTEWNATNSSTIVKDVAVSSSAQQPGLAEGKYYLTSDVEINKVRIEMNKEVTICLNGHTIKNSADQEDGASLIDLAAGSGGTTVLNICDCTGNGTLTRTDDTTRQGAIIYQRSKTTVNLHNISVIAPTVNTDDNACSIYVAANAALNIDGTTFTPTAGKPDARILGTISIASLGSNMVVRGAAAIDTTLEYEKDATTEWVTVKPAASIVPPPSNTADNANLTLMVAGLLVGICGIASVAILPKKQSV